MRKKKTYHYHNKMLCIAKWLLTGISLLLFVALMAMKGREELTQMLSNPTFNAFYLLCMFDVICCIELWYFHKLLRENSAFESVMLCVVLMIVAQLFLMNAVMVVILSLFLFKTLRFNGMRIRNLYGEVKKQRTLAIPAFHLTLSIVSVSMIYVTVLYRFA